MVVIGIFGKQRWPYLDHFFWGLLCWAVFGISWNIFSVKRLLQGKHRELRQQLTNQHNLVSRNQSIIEAVVRSYMSVDIGHTADNEHAFEKLVLLKTAQSMTFDGNAVDDRLWIQLGHHIINDGTLEFSDRLDYLLQLKREESLTVRDNDTYPIIEYLFSLVKQYDAVAAPWELENAESRRFLLEAPLYYQNVHVRRIFIIKSPCVFSQLEQQDKDKLKKQLEFHDRIEIKYMIDGQCVLPPVCGIYDAIAAGEMKDGINTLKFHKNQIQVLRNLFDRAWDSRHCISLKKEDLRGRSVSP
jgi:hypothetical protein